ncbi:transporter [Hymenobacter cellulosivorans]|uniref:Transporter n=1 Tax=Hymenobacter cellulosivorans TaxID=2932249 RepID=A0ABY4FBT2_9BACT|nr:transporter [Hymenobacter cellulosivorans]UOQ53447.1 transporter [Hymenobacter cellulosivorans]
MKFCSLLLTTLVLPFWAAAQNQDSITAKAGYNLFRPTPRNMMRELRPDRPGYSESPFTVDPGHFQIESDLLRLVNKQEEQHHERNFYLNHALLKLGVTTRTDVQAELDSYSVEKEWDDDQPEEKHQGFGDLTLRVKHTFLGEDGKPDALALIGFVRLPVGPAVGTSVTEYGLIVPYSHDFSKQFNLQFQLRSDLDYDRDEQQRYVMLAPSTAVDVEFSEFLSAFAEVVGIWNTRQNAWQANFNVGPQLHLSDNLIVDFGTHLALTKETDHEYFLGVSFRR